MRPLRPARAARKTSAAALRLVMASLPLIPWTAAHADATVPGDKGKPGDTKPQPTPPDRMVPPPPGGIAPPHLPPEPEKKKKK